jgi:hypothetical protein
LPYLLVKAFVAYLPYWKHNANIHISLLYKFLWQSITNTSNLPFVLYLQLDNCAKDNKNQYELLISLIFAQ